MILCINKFRDNSGKIVGYRLNDNDSTMMQDVAADVLKDRIRRGMIKVDNLRLTSDGRLVDCNPYGMPDTSRKIMIQEYRNGRPRGVEYIDTTLDQISQEELQRRTNRYNSNTQVKVSEVTVSNIRPVKEIAVNKFNDDGTYEAKGILGLMNMMTKRREMKIKGLE